MKHGAGSLWAFGTPSRSISRRSRKNQRRDSADVLPYKLVFSHGPQIDSQDLLGQAWL
jgi:hypothetical protein